MKAFHMLSVLITLLLASPTAKAQRPGIDLGGEWSTQIGTCRLPGTTDESRLGFRNESTTETSRLTRLYSYTGKLRYEREIDIPKSFEGKKLLLVMERTKPSTLWFDGDSLGHQTHIYAPHRYTFGPVSAGTHRIAIDVDNSFSEVPSILTNSHAYTENTQTNWNGILGEFRIEALPDTYIESMKVFTDTEEHLAKIILHICSADSGTKKLSGKISTWKTGDTQTIPIRKRKVKLAKGANTLELTVDLGEHPALWSEFHPALYKAEITIGDDSQSTNFGVRDLKVEGNRITVNGHPVFLRGKHDGCVFPLTGYAPMDVESWVRYFSICKEYGINHCRYHSWAPPKAAFEAADITGIYLQPELPMWGAVDPEKKELNSYLLNEGKMLLDYAADSPSFLSLGLGNELNGDVDEMRRWVNELRAHDSRPLYDFGSNNFLGYKGQLEGEDILITCRTDNPDGSLSTVRASFAFVDESDGGRINGERPCTDRDFGATVTPSKLPVIGHETGQFQFFPDYSQTDKYSGITYPFNLRIFENRLKANGLSDQAEAFRKANNTFAVECYKEDIEFFLRTRSMAGFEMLDLQDYPGQGTALVGILDAFMESKGAVTPEEFRGWCSELVPLARFSDFCWWNDQTFHAEIMLSNFTEAPWDQGVRWTATDGRGWTMSGAAMGTAPDGEVSSIGSIDIPLSGITGASRITLTLIAGQYRNRYRLWVYPRTSPSAEGIRMATRPDEITRAALEAGRTVLLTPEPVDSLNLGGMFIPNYWNYTMFRNVSLNAGRKVSPGTMGILVDPGHPLFRNFPTDMGSDWQWWAVTTHSSPMILDPLKGYEPVVQVIDNYERNHRLGIISEFSVGPGKLLICNCDLGATAGTPEGDAFVTALYDYLRSDEFHPDTRLSWEELQALFSARYSDEEATVLTAADYSITAERK